MAITPDDYEKMWPSAKAELTGFANVLDHRDMGITATQIRIAIALAIRIAIALADEAIQKRKDVKCP